MYFYFESTNSKSCTIEGEKYEKSQAHHGCKISPCGHHPVDTLLTAKYFIQCAD